MGSSKKAAPAPSPKNTSTQLKSINTGAISAPASPYTIDPRGNITVTGNITGDQLRQAQEEAKVIRQAPAEANKNTAIYGSESVADVQAREQQTLANPKKAKVRGRRSLVSNPIGTSSAVLG